MYVCLCEWVWAFQNVLSLRNVYQRYTICIPIHICQWKNISMCIYYLYSICFLCLQHANSHLVIWQHRSTPEGQEGWRCMGGTETDSSTYCIYPTVTGRMMGQKIKIKMEGWCEILRLSSCWICHSILLCIFSTTPGLNNVRAKECRSFRKTHTWVTATYFPSSFISAKAKKRKKKKEIYYQKVFLAVIVDPCLLADVPHSSIYDVVSQWCIINNVNSVLYSH